MWYKNKPCHHIRGESESRKLRALFIFSSDLIFAPICIIFIVFFFCCTFFCCGLIFFSLALCHYCISSLQCCPLDRCVYINIIAIPRGVTQAVWGTKGFSLGIKSSLWFIWSFIIAELIIVHI